MDSNWIWAEGWDAGMDGAPTAVFFRKVVVLDGEAERACIRISADSKYKLYVNGELVEAGPSKGDGQIWFYDGLDIAGWLKPGKNVLAVTVLRFPLKPGAGNQSAVGTHIPGLFLSGKIEGRSGQIIDISADRTWKCKVDVSTRFVAEAEGFAPLHIYEDVSASRDRSLWRQGGYDDSTWKQAVLYPKAAIREAVSPGNLNPRTIPFMRRSKGRFIRVLACRKPGTGKEAWERLIRGDGGIEIPAGSEWIAELDAGEEMTGYLHLLVEKGSGAVLHLLQAESYFQTDPLDPKAPSFKADRTDSKNGHLEGFTDVYRPSGTGSAGQPEEYEPFWFRTFRFLQVKAAAGPEPLVIRDIYFEETGYPLEIKSRVETSDPSLASIWDISARTMKRCMQETYTDCPFYEQLQYVMDSRSQALYTYAAAADDRLARKCMDDFKRAQRYDGLLCSAYPNTRPNVIPGFSIYYILMLHDHMMYFGDRDLIRFHMPAVEGVLAFFGRNLTEKGYVGKVGGFYHQEKFWSFIDWAAGWKAGVPGAAEKGALTMESLLYLMGLQKVEEMAAYIGRPGQAGEYRVAAEALAESIRKNCMNPGGWVQDGPGVEEYSQHCQVFGILTGVLDPKKGRDILKDTLVHKERYAQCTVSMAWYLFRALELTGLYGETDRCWDIWREMVGNHLTTVAESDISPRSDCHAWGALALYELPSAILGVRPAAPGYGKVEVRPVPGYLSWAKGEAVTPKGMVLVSWKMNDGKLEVDYHVS